MEGHILAGERAVQHLAPQGSNEILLTPDTVVLAIHRGRAELDEAGRFVRQPGMRKRRSGDPDNEPGVRERGIAYVGDYVDTYDSRHYIIQPGYFSTTLGCALHFKARAVVPGSRNPETNSETSFLAILGVAEPMAGGLKIVKRVDDVDDWEPFTDEECAEYGMKVEALDRAHMVDPIIPASEVQIADTSAVLAGAKNKSKTPAAKPSRVSGAKGNSGGRTGGSGAARGKATKIETTDATILDPLDPANNAALQEINRDRIAQANEGGRG